MTIYLDLLGKNPEEIEKELTLSHANLLNTLNQIKEDIKNNNNLSHYTIISQKHFEQLQNYLMDSTGYISKNVNYRGKEVIVTFGGAIFPSNELTGRGDNELEALCNACDNFIKNPYKYNTHSIKYLNQLNNVRRNKKR